MATNSESYWIPDEGALRSDWRKPAPTFAEALAHFDRYPWHRFVPLVVDPSVRADVETAWNRKQAADSHTNRQLERWRQAFRDEPPRRR